MKVWPKPEYDNRGNGGFSEWWEIEGICRVYNEEDAQFIAAAPDLLFMLKQTIPFLERLSDHNNKEAGQTRDAAYCLLSNVKQAINKAEPK